MMINIKLAKTVGGVCLTALLLTFFSLDVCCREVFSINDGWTFRREDTSLAETVHLPHCWNSDSYYTRDYYRGKGTYRKELKIPAAAVGKTVYLKFDGAASRSSVTVDGKPAGEHMGAYSSHVIDISDFVVPGESHIVEVSVDNSDPSIPPYSADFTFMGGLYRDAWLIVADDLHLAPGIGPDCGFKVWTEQGAIGWTLRVLPYVSGTPDGGTEISLSLIGPDGSVIAEKTEKVLDISDKGVEIGNIGNIDLWSPETPILYRVKVSLVKNGNVADMSECYTAFRTFAFDDQGRFILNGNPYKLRGMCRHQDQKPMGIALTDEQHRRDMRLIKDMGANFVRISHYPQDDAVLEMCDRMGLIAWEEIPIIDYVPENADFTDNCETMLREMVRRHYNHPSIAMWGYMNEILLRMPDENKSATVERTLKLAERFECVLSEEDSTRLSTMAFHGSDIYNESGLAEITDVKGWNLYQGWYGGRLDYFESFLSTQHRNHPDHKIIVSEYGAGSDMRIHSLSPEPFDFSMEYQQKYLEHYLPVIEDSVFVAGASHWNFIDFSSANRAESMPHINNKGLVTNQRYKKDIYYFYKTYWRDIKEDTVAHIAVRDWPVRTELIDESGYVTRPVKIYTNLPEAELIVNGHTLGVKAGKNHTMVFDTPLSAGNNVLELKYGDQIRDVAVVNINAISVKNGLVDPDKDELAINVGSRCYFRSEDSGVDWLPDMEYSENMPYGYTGGKFSTSQDEIALTADDPLFQHCVVGIEQYRLNVVPGRYEVELYFADLSSPSVLSAYMLGHNAGSEGVALSHMDVWVNGNKVETDFAPAAASGVRTMVRKRYVADSTDGSPIIVAFNPVAGGSTCLSAIKIRKL